MDLNSLSVEQLRLLAIAFGVGAFLFGLVFLGSAISYSLKMANRNSSSKKDSPSPAETPAPAAWMQTLKGQPPAGENTASTPRSKGEMTMTQPTPQNSQNKKPRKKGLLKSATPKATPAPKPPAESAAPAPRELLRVLVDPQTRHIILEVDGERYTSLKDVTDKQIGQRILEVVALLVQFTGGVVATASGIVRLQKLKARLSQLPDPPAPVSPPAPADDFSAFFGDDPAPASADEPAPVNLAQRLGGQSPSTSLPPETPPAEEDFGGFDDWTNPQPTPSQTPPQSQSQSESEKGGSRLADFMADIEAARRLSGTTETESNSGRRGFFNFGGGKASEEPEELPALDLAGEIDKVVQRKLREQAIPTSVKISSGPMGTVRITVAGQQYESVEDVADPQMKALIKSAIQEWERA